MDKNLLHNKHCLLAKKSYKNAHNCASKLKKKNVDPCEDMDLRRKRKKNRNKIKCLMTSSASKRKPKKSRKKFASLQKSASSRWNRTLDPRNVPQPTRSARSKTPKTDSFHKEEKNILSLSNKVDSPPKGR